MNHKPHAIVVGAGLAGLACALRLGEMGVRVTLLEARRRVGGRASSFVDATTNETIDNCQHVAMGCCDAYLGLLRTLDAVQHLEWHDAQYWILAEGTGGGEGGVRRVRRSVIRPMACAGVLPRLVSHASSFALASFLSLSSKLAISQAALAISTLSREDFRDLTFGDWLCQHQQPAEAIERFWRPVVVSACNLEPEAVCATTALHVFQDGVFGGAKASRIGIPRVPLATLYERAEALLAARGGTLLAGEAAEAIGPTRVRTRVGSDCREHAGDVVVCALPMEKAMRLLPSDDRLARLAGFGHSPILGVHVRFDRGVMDVPHAVLVERPTQWLFRKDEAGTTLHAVVSAADAWMDLTQEKIMARVLADVYACLLGSVGARVLHARVVKERLATFAATPAFERARPGPLHVTRPGEHVVLAGDYTDTGWPATMEGATRSGHAAADAAATLLRRR